MNEITPIPGIGHNSADLSAILAEESEPLKTRAESLIAAFGRAAVTDDETAGKAATLAKMMKECQKAIDEARVARKEPFLEGGRTVDAHFKAISATLDGPIKSTVGMIDAFRREQEAKAEAERRRLAEEARKQQEQAEAAERARLAAIQSGDGAAALDAEMAARTADENAQAIAARAASVTAAPIDGGMGAKAFGRKVWTAEITDQKAALKHAMKVDSAAIMAAVQSVYDRQVKAGVRDLPGATVHETTQTVIR